MDAAEKRSFRLQAWTPWSIGIGGQLDRNSFGEGASRDLAKKQDGVANPGGK